MKIFDNKWSRLVLLHFNILLFSCTGIFSKCLANSININGIIHMNTLLFSTLIILNCGIYAVIWQQNLKHFDVNVAYSNRSVYNIWSLLWSILIFSEHITIGNIIGTALIIIGVLIVQNDK